MFRITEGKGFALIFDNGLKLSTQIGPGNYCDNYATDIVDFYNQPLHRTFPCSHTAEIAIIDTLREDEFVTGDILGNDEVVMGYVNMKDWLKILTKVKNWKRKEEKME